MVIQKEERALALDQNQRLPRLRIRKRLEIIPTFFLFLL